MMKSVQVLAEEYLELAKYVGGCGDGGCVVLKPEGLRTNGGCRCCYRMDAMRERGVARLLSKAQLLARAALGEGKE